MNRNFIAINKRQNPKQGRGFVEECPLAEYDQLTREKRLSELVELIGREQDEEKQRELKGRLPFRCPHYTRFLDNHRTQDAIDPESFTWMTCVDIDQMELVEGARKRAMELNAEQGGMWQDMVLHMDYSARRKLHIDIRLPLGMTVPEAQRAFCEALGVEPDESCFTPERFIYITPSSFEIYRSPHWYEQLSEEEVAKRRKAYTDRGLEIDGRSKDNPKAYPSPIPSEARPLLSPSASDRWFPLTRLPVAFPVAFSPVGEATKKLTEKETSKETPLPTGEGQGERLFKGIPYTSIIAEYWRRTGGEPLEGERNVKLHKLACNLRAICDNNEEWLLEVMPRLGLSTQEMRSIIHSACKEPTKGSKLIDSIVKTMLTESKEETEGAEDTEDDIEDASAIQHPLLGRGLGRLPIGLRESLSGVPESMYLPVLCSVLPIAAAYADQVEVEYCDGNHQRLGLMSIIRGEQASGKSVCKKAVDVWKRQFDEEDALARRREEEWKERKKARKANEKAPDDPKVLIRAVPVTVSCSTLLKRFKNANGHCLYSFCEELDTLRKTNGAGSWSSKYDIYRLSFDNGEWGQDYNSDQAESGVVNVAYNWTMLGTDGALRKCFRQDNIENGLSSRVLVAEMPDASFAKMPKYGKRSADDEAKIQEAVTRLRSYSGFIDTPRLRKAIEQWVEEKRVEAAKDIDRVKDVYRKRAAVIGFRCGVVFHLLSGKSKETKGCLDFALMMAEYTLQQQISAFGEALQKEYDASGSGCKRNGVNNSVFDQLAPSFTMEDLRALKHDCSESGIRNIVMRWKRDGWIESIDRHHWRKIS